MKSKKQNKAVPFVHDGWAMVLKSRKGWVPGIFKTHQEAYQNAWRELLNGEKLELEYVRLRPVRLPKPKADAILRELKRGKTKGNP